MIEMFVLVLLMQLKHYVADFPLQTVYMSGKFNREGWIKPLSAHCLVHMLLTLVLLVGYVAFMGRLELIGLVMVLVLFDGASHFFIDRVKAHPDMGGKYCVNDKQFWDNLGLDQLAHQVVGLVIALELVAAL